MCCEAHPPNSFALMCLFSTFGTNGFSHFAPFASSACNVLMHSQNAPKWPHLGSQHPQLQAVLMHASWHANIPAHCRSSTAVCRHGITLHSNCYAENQASLIHGALKGMNSNSSPQDLFRNAFKLRKHRFSLPNGPDQRIATCLANLSSKGVCHKRIWIQRWTGLMP